MTTILTDLRMATPDVPARRAFLIDAAEHAELLDSLHRDDLLERYADPQISGGRQQGLFSELTDEVRWYLDLRDWRQTGYITGDGLNKDEAMQAHAQRIEELVEELVPSPAIYTGPAEKAIA